VFPNEGLIDHWTINRLDQFDLNFSYPAYADQKLEGFSDSFAIDVQVFQRLLGEGEHCPGANLQILDPCFRAFFQISGYPGDLMDLPSFVEFAKFVVGHLG
jgi:hypothetical protein